MGIAAVCFPADERKEDYEEKHENLYEKTGRGGGYLYDDVDVAGRKECGSLWG